MRDDLRRALAGPSLDPAAGDGASGDGASGDGASDHVHDATAAAPDALPTWVLATLRAPVRGTPAARAAIMASLRTMPAPLSGHGSNPTSDHASRRPLALPPSWRRRGVASPIAALLAAGFTLVIGGARMGETPRAPGPASRTDSILALPLLDGLLDSAVTRAVRQAVADSLGDTVLSDYRVAHDSAGDTLRRPVSTRSLRLRLPLPPIGAPADATATSSL